MADIELVTDAVNSEVKRLQLVILESLIIRKDIPADVTQGSTSTKFNVAEGQEILPKAVVAKTEVLCKESGIVRGVREGAEAIRRILILREKDCFTIATNEKPRFKVGSLLIAGSEIAPGVFTEESAQVIEIAAQGKQEAAQGNNQLSTSAYKVTLRIARPYRVSPGAMLQVDDAGLVQRGDNLVLLVFERTKTGDIIQGLPRIEELLEARKPKEACILAVRPGTVELTRVEDETHAIKVIEDNDTITDYPLGPGQNPVVSDGSVVDVGMQLTDGPANPHEILEVFFNYYSAQKDATPSTKALQKVQNFLVNEVQLVYQSQGIDIADKHIETIVRQMTAKVRVDDGGDTTILPGELIELRQIEQVNVAMSITGGALAQYTPMLLGITKASLNTDSFISAASFQETTRVLTEAAIEGKSDWLRGLKENVIIGRLIPAGTGFNAYEEPLSVSEEPTLEATSVFEESDDPLDVVLDDRTARAYSFESGLGEGFNFDRGAAVAPEEELVDDAIDDLEDDDEEEDDDDDDDFEDDDE